VAFNAPWPADFAYYVVTRPGARARPGPVAAFVDWLLEEASMELIGATGST